MTSSRPQGAAQLVDDAAREALRRVVRRSVAWWRTRTPAGRTRAGATYALVVALAAYEHALDLGAAPPPPDGYRAPAPSAREDVLVDQLAVVAYDLVLALREHPPDAPARLPAGRGPATAALLAAHAAAECLLLAHEVDPRPLPADLVDAVLAAGPGDLRAAVARLPRLRQA